MGLSRHEYWSRLPCSPPGDLPNPGFEPGSPELQADSLPLKPSEKHSLSLFLSWNRSSRTFNIWPWPLLSFDNFTKITVVLDQFIISHFQSRFRYNMKTFIAKARELQKNICFCFIDYAKAFVWITTNCGKFFKRREYQTTSPASWEICMQIKKQQLELDMDHRLVSNRERSMSRLYIVTLLI